MLPEVAWCHKFNTGHLRSPDGKRAIRCAFVGCADILGQMATGEFMAIECKIGKDKPTGDQAAFLASVDRRGGCAGWVRDSAGAAELIRAFAARARAPSGA